MKGKIKIILKNTGKTLATIACPPIGLAMCPKDISKKTGAGIVGVVISIFGTAALIKGEPSYNNISTRYLVNSMYRTIGEAFFSPLLARLDSYEGLELKTQDKSFNIERDALQFSNGKYQLNLSPETRFSNGIDNKRLTDFESEVKKYQSQMQDYLESGDLLNARKTGEKLDTARKNLENVRKDYEETRQAFQSAVDNMNSELKQLAQQAQ